MNEAAATLLNMSVDSIKAVYECELVLSQQKEVIQAQTKRRLALCE